MGSRRRAWAVWGLLLACGGASSCVLGGDSDRPVMAVDLFWDSDPGKTFRPESCDEAGVEYMSWVLRDKKGKSLAESDSDLEECKPLDFIGLSPGTYELEVHGYDSEKSEHWATKCTDLELDRFDVLYECDVEMTEPTEPDDSNDADAGGSDAGTADAG